jgi:hypothetical protein
MKDKDKPPYIKGQISELAFMSKITNLGGLISKPVHPSSPYDFIIDFESRLSRVQVKSTWIRRFDTYGEYFHIKALGYNESNVDYIACYIQPNDSWYIIPIENIHSSYLRFDERSVFEEFKEKWNLF